MRTQSAGYSLTESVVAILIIGIVASAISSTILSAGKEQSVSDRRQQAGFYSDLLRQTLRGYVVADQGALPTAQELADLHNSMRGYLGCAANCQKLPGDPCGNWALEPGCTHDASVLLAPEFRALPIGGKMTYEVSLGRDGRSVKIDVDWTEPQS